MVICFLIMEIYIKEHSKMINMMVLVFYNKIKKFFKVYLKKEKKQEFFFVKKITISKNNFI